MTTRHSTSPFNPTEPIRETRSGACIVCEAPCLPGAVLCHDCDADPRPDLEAIVAGLAARFPVGELARAIRFYAQQEGLGAADREELRRETDRELSRRFEAFCGRAGRPRTARTEEL